MTLFNKNEMYLKSIYMLRKIFVGLSKLPSQSLVVVVLRAHVSTRHIRVRGCGVNIELERDKELKNNKLLQNVFVLTADLPQNDSIVVNRMKNRQHNFP